MFWRTWHPDSWWWCSLVSGVQCLLSLFIWFRLHLRFIPSPPGLPQFLPFVCHSFYHNFLPQFFTMFSTICLPFLHHPSVGRWSPWRTFRPMGFVEAPSWPWTATPWNWSARNCCEPKRRNEPWRPRPRRLGFVGKDLLKDEPEDWGLGVLMVFLILRLGGFVMFWNPLESGLPIHSF